MGRSVVKFDAPAIRRRLNNLVSTTGPNNAEVRGMYRQWSVRYSSEVKREFKRNSDGGGNWAPLQPETIARRRSGKGGTIGGQRRKAIHAARRAKTDRQGRAAARKVLRVAASIGKVKILRDTGMLFNSLSHGAPGHLFKFLNNGVRMGIGGSVKHKGGKATLGQIAVWHSTGKGPLPKREILVPANKLTERTRKGMQRDVQVLLDKIGPQVKHQ